MHPLSPKRFQIVYSDSGGGALKQAAMMRGERLTGRLPYGPIHEAFLGPLDLIAHPAARREWRAAHDAETSAWWGLEEADIRNADLKATEWWENLRQAPPAATIWYCSRDAADVSFLLTLMHEIGFGDDTFLIDMADTTVGEPATSVGGCTSEQILQAASAAEPLDQSKRDALEQEFQRLTRDCKGLRRFDDDGVLQEAPIDAHDETILQFIPSDWRSYKYVMVDIYNSQADRMIRHLDYCFVLWRVDKLIEAGRIERRGKSREPLFVENPMMGDLRQVN